ncbi:hypothetical protein CRUP_012252 [Coryphaenoides rupestris]|nr:hypothetical protein CRUP_012252 [Coryphaenoides rupestris]
MEEKKGVAERLTLGITRILESMPGVADTRFVEREPAEKRSLLSWEQKNTCILPEDLRDFYLTTDGFTLTWSVTIDTAAPSTLFSLPNAPVLADLDYDGDSTESESEDCPAVPHFDSRSRIFELDSCGGNGKVCLVYRNCCQGVVAQQSHIWFLDRSLYWHYLTATFTAYYRLMLTHLGLPEWQYTFTPYGPSPQAKQWESLYPPLTFHRELGTVDPAGGNTHFTNKLDPTKALKGKSKVATPKKKQSTQSAPGGSGKGHVSVGKHAVIRR